MQHWEEKISVIEQKIYKLVELNTNYKQVCENLLQAKRQLEQENAQLRQQLLDAQQQQQQQLPPQTNPEPTPDTVATKANVSAPNDNDFAQEKEFIKKQISQYIRDIDSTIQWIQSLAAPHL
jgi:small-conductance mechanosensitive channel